MKKYDVFISAKSNDYAIARIVYNYLQSIGVSAFMADEDLRKQGQAEYGEVIDEVIDNCTHMIVITSNPNFLFKKSSPYVHHEWYSFSEEQKSGRKTGNLITILTPNVSINQLPLSLRTKQSFTIDNFQQNIDQYLTSSLSTTPPIYSAPIAQPNQPQHQTTYPPQTNQPPQQITSTPQTNQSPRQSATPTKKKTNITKIIIICVGALLATWLLLFITFSLAGLFLYNNNANETDYNYDEDVELIEAVEDTIDHPDFNSISINYNEISNLDPQIFWGKLRAGMFMLDDEDFAQLILIEETLSSAIPDDAHTNVIHSIEDSPYLAREYLDNNDYQTYAKLVTKAVYYQYTYPSETYAYYTDLKDNAQNILQQYDSLMRTKGLTQKQIQNMQLSDCLAYLDYNAFGQYAKAYVAFYGPNPYDE